MRTLAERFWPKVDQNGPMHPALGTACWLWVAAVDSRDYGRISEGGRGSRELKAHRVSWAIRHGSIDPNLHACHHCDNPRCVNPSHLFLGTDADNHRDCKAKGRSRNGNAAKTHCARGHELTTTKYGFRRCMPCFRANRNARQKVKYREDLAASRAKGRRYAAVHREKKRAVRS